MVADSPITLHGGASCSCTLSTVRQAVFLSALAVASWLLSSTALCAQLTVLPNTLELTGQDPIHGVIVSLTDDQGKITDVSHRVTFQVDKPELVAVDQRGVMELRPMAKRY